MSLNIVHSTPSCHDKLQIGFDLAVSPSNCKRWVTILIGRHGWNPSEQVFKWLHGKEFYMGLQSREVQLQMGPMAVRDLHEEPQGKSEQLQCAINHASQQFLDPSRPLCSDFISFELPLFW